MPVATDRHLLFGLLALQTGLISEEQLVRVCRDWSGDKSRPLDERLLALGYLDEVQRAAINDFAKLHFEARDGNLDASLGSIWIDETIRAELASIGDPDLDATLPLLVQFPTEALAKRTPGGEDAVSPAAAAGRSVKGRAAPSPGGRFQILRPHAKGAVGAVSVALDLELNREVALKQILESHADNPAIRGRFLIEAEITGALEHPGVVPVYGLGVGGDDLPYYAMRLIQGDSLADAIAAFHAGPKAEPQRTLEFRRLLKKFTDICDTIAYAHSRGVLHRDIKPSNVVVGKHGETLVVDWGLAKALGRSAPDVDERTLVPAAGDDSSFTIAGQAMGTPAYMSPEQARGELERLGPRSDVYSLGATLHHLLTGRPPFQGTVVDVLTAVETGDFRRPRAVDASIDPALEAIVLKAMAVAPQARYPSAKALADDVDRWLADERVEAHRESPTRTLIRWLTRHRTSVTGLAAAGLVAFIGLGIISTVQTKAGRELDAKNHELSRLNANLAASNKALNLQRDRAEASESEAIDAVKRFTEAISNNPELKSNPKLAPLRKALLNEPLSFFSELRRRLQAAADARPEALLKLAGVARAHAALLSEIDNMGASIGAFQQAIQILERLVGDYPDVAERQAQLAGVHHDLGYRLYATGRYEEARAAYQRGIDIRERLILDHPDHAGYRREQADNFANLGILLAGMGRTTEARAAYQREIELRERLLGDQPGVASLQAGLAQARRRLVSLRSDGEDQAALAEAFGREIETYERLVRDAPDNEYYGTVLANAHQGLGSVLAQAGRLDEARAECGRAIEIRERLVREHPTAIIRQAELMEGRRCLGWLLHLANRLDEARVAYERAIEIGERLVRDHPDVVNCRTILAQSHVGLGNLLRDMGRDREAQEAYQRAVEVQQRLVRNHPDALDYRTRLGEALNSLAELDVQASRFSEARQRLLPAIDRQAQIVEAEPGNAEHRRVLALLLGNLIQAERGLGREDEAVRLEDRLAELQINDPTAKAAEAQLQAVLSGAAPKDAAELLRLARRAYDTSRFRAAARLWGEALGADPTLADDRQTQHAYNAARAAALAAAGKGIDPPDGDAEKTRLRGLALGWLNAERDLWARLLESGGPSARELVARTIRYWGNDPDLAGVRDPSALAKLPEDDRAAWRTFWDGAAQLLREAE